MPDRTTISASQMLWPDGRLAAGAVTIEGDRIVSVEATTRAVPERILVPGFVDLQVNGVDAVDVPDATGSDWERLDEALVAQGVTTWCPTLITAPWDQMVDAAARIAEAARRDIAPRPRIAGVHLEGPWLGDRTGAHPPEHVVVPTARDVAALPTAVALVTMGAEVPGAVEVCRSLVERGVAVSLGHTAASYEDGAAMVDAGARVITHVGNATGPIAARAPGVFGLGLVDDRLAVCVIADLVHVHPATLRLTASAARDRLVLVTDSVAWRSPSHVARGIEMRDGAPRLADGTIAGSALTMDAAIRNVVAVGAASLPEALRAASSTPCRVLGASDRGEIRVGALADLVALSPDLRVEEVWIGGASR